MCISDSINVLRDNDPKLMLFCVTPYEEQATKWTPELRERYFDMLIKCTHMTAGSPEGWDVWGNEVECSITLGKEVPNGVCTGPERPESLLSLIHIWLPSA